MKHIAFIITAVFCYLVTIGQTPKIEKLRQQLYRANTNSERLDKYLLLLEEKSSLPVDSIWHYIENARMLASTTKDAHKVSEIKLSEALVLLRTGNEKKAKAIIDSMSQKYTVDHASTRSLYFKLAEAKMSCLDYSNDFNGATAIGYGIIREAEKYKDSVTVTSVYNSISCWNYNMDFVRKAININREALQGTGTSPKFYEVRSGISINLGEQYWWQEQLDSAEYFIKYGIDYAKRAENLFLQYHGLQKMSLVKSSKKQFRNAEKDILESIEIYKKYNGDIPSSRNVITMANLYRNWGKTDSAINVIIRGLAIDSIYRKNTKNQNEEQSIDNMQDMYLYNLLGNCYKDKGDHEKYSSILEKIISKKDSIYKVNAADALAELQTKFDVQQKENTITKQNLLLAKRQNTIIAVLAVISVLAITSFFLFREYRKRQRRRSRAAVKDAEEKERKRIAADLHDNLGVQANAILYTSELLKEGENTDSTLVSNMNETAKDMLFFLRETLWALKSADTTTTQLWFRILNFCKQMKRNYPHIEFTTEGNADKELPISSARALNILMIVQEATNNCIKHSKASTVGISSLFENNQWQITVADNGAGFNLAEAHEKEESNGLKNMQQRADSSGIQLQIIPQQTKGTMIQLSIPFE